MRVLVVGDVIIDRYTHGTRRGISAETPTIVANLTKEEMFVGGAGLVVRNLLRLENLVALLTVGRSRDLNLAFRHSADPLTAYERSRLIVDQIETEGWDFTEKHRYFVEQYKLLQYDTTNKGKHDKYSESAFKKRFELELTDDTETVIVCDNRHGVISANLAKFIVKRCKERGKKLLVDSQVSQSASNHDWYKGADYIFLNEIELDHAVKKAWKKPGATTLEIARMHLMADIVYKRGERGAVLQRSKPQPSEGFKVDAVDTCGAGDAFLAAFAHSGGDLEFANRWAALSTTYKGTIVPRLQDLEKVKR